MTTASATREESRIVLITGSKIDLVIIEKGDARTLATYMNDSAVTRYLLRYLPLHIGAEERWIESMAERKNGLTLGIVPKGGTTLIGTTGLGWNNTQRDRTASFGLTIGDRNSWGKGYGTEATSLILTYAFNTLDLRGVELCLYGNNIAARKVYERCGFVEIGRIANWLYLSPGKYDDEIMMVCMRPE